MERQIQDKTEQF